MCTDEGCLTVDIDADDECVSLKNEYGVLTLSKDDWNGLVDGIKGSKYKKI